MIDRTITSKNMNIIDDLFSRFLIIILITELRLTIVHNSHRSHRLNVTNSDIDSVDGISHLLVNLYKNSK